jgi:acetyl-CoA acetyltransferase
MSDVLICAALRTPVGKRGGNLRSLSRASLAERVHAALAQHLQVADVRVNTSDSLADALHAVQSEESAFRCVLSSASASNEPLPEPDGDSAAEIAARWKIGRQWLDQFTQESHEKAGLVHHAGFLNDEIVLVEVFYPDGTLDRVDRDQLPRADARLEEFSFLPTLKPNGIITSAHLSLPADGAAVIALCSAAMARDRSWTPRVKLVAVAAAETEPRLHGAAAVPAAEALLEQTGRHKIEIGLWEIHEGTAAHTVATLAELDPPLDRVNVWGGALAIGDPPGTSSLRMIATLAHQMPRYGVKYGVAAWNEDDVRGQAVLLELIA